MNLYRFTPQAENDLFEIWSYIARDSVDAADRVEATVYEACAFLADGPLRGHSRQDLTNLPLRFWTVPRYPTYIVVYDPQSRPLQIIRILQGARNIATVLKIAPEAIQAMRKLEEYVRGSGLERSLLELVRFRASEMNGCTYCVDMHTQDTPARAARFYREFTRSYTARPAEILKLSALNRTAW
ncbi:MAG: type II toxin-antitoxin system RelE/ParE family toxin [Terriglobia bacterium]